MRKALRILAASLGGLVVLVLSLALSSVTGVDRRPAAEAGWHQTTLDRLSRLQASPDAGTNRLEAGFGKALLTPRLITPGTAGDGDGFEAIPMAGFGARQGRPATGTHDDLWAKAVALRRGRSRAVMVSADALIIPRNVADAAAALVAVSTDLRREDLYFGATHTHGSLGGWGEGPVGEMFAGAFDPRAVRWFASRLAAAIIEAWNHPESASAGGSGFEAPDLVRNRLVGDSGRVDPWFDLLVIRQDDGDSAVLGSFSAHATVLGAGVMEWTADYPGAWERAVEAATGGMAVFFAGGVGSHAPRPPVPGFEGAEGLGRELAGRTLRAIEGLALDARPELRLLTLRTDLPELQVRVTDGLRLRPLIAGQLLPVADDTRLQALRLGNRMWFSTPCDFSGELTLELREHLAPLGVGIHVTSFNGDYVGYVIPSRYYGLDGYEPRTMSFHGPALAGYFMELLEDLGRRTGAPARVSPVGTRTSRVPEPAGPRD